MRLRSCDISEFIRRAHGREVVCWGAGFCLSFLSEKYKSGIENTFSYVVDSNSEIQGTKIMVCNREFEIKPPCHLFENINDNTIILISVRDCNPIYSILEEKFKQANNECYTVPLINMYELDKIFYSVEPIPIEWRMNSNPQIPKVIHYCWFGGTPLPDKFKSYIDSWYKYCPDYEIIQWDESNYDINSHKYMREITRGAKHPGRAANYARLDIVYNHGGVYLDVDVELLRNIDELLYCSAFCGFHGHEYINFGSGFGAKKNHSMIKAMLDAHDDPELLDNMSKYTTSPAYETKVMIRYGLQLGGQFQVVNDMAVYPSIYFEPLSIRTGKFFGTPDSYSIHHYAATWFPDEEMERKDFDKKLLTAVRDD